MTTMYIPSAKIMDKNTTRHVASQMKTSDSCK